MTPARPHVEQRAAGRRAQALPPPRRAQFPQSARRAQALQPLLAVRRGALRRAARARRIAQ